MAKKTAKQTAQTENDQTASPEDAEIDSEVIPPKENAREQMLDTIVGARHQQLRDNEVDLGDEPDEEDDKGDKDARASEADEEDSEDDRDDKAADDTEADEEDAAAAEGEEAPDEEEADEAGEQDDADEDDKDATGEDDEPGERMVTITVDGQQREVTESWLLAQGQKLLAAEERMQKANEILDAAMQAHQMAASGGQPGGQPQQPGPDGQPQGGPDQPALDEQDSKRLAELRQKAVDAIQYGSKEEGNEALGELIDEVISKTRSQGVSVDPEATQNQIKQAVNDTVEWQSSVARFGKEYEDIISDPHLQRVTAQRAQELFHEAVTEARRQGRPGRPAYWAIFRQAGEETRQWLNTVRGGTEGDSPGTKPKPNQQRTNVSLDNDQRKAAKRKTSTSPKPRTIQRSKGAGEAKQKTPNEIRREGIADIMNRRQGANVA